MKPHRMTVTAVAARLGIATSTWRAYVTRGQAPAPDGHADPCGCPWWWSTTIEELAAARPRTGRRGSDARPRKRRAPAGARSDAMQDSPA